MSAEQAAHRLIREVTAKVSNDLSKAMYEDLGSDNPKGYDRQWVEGYLAACEAMRDYGQRVTDR